jgi:uncharacterized protein involved in exopolysaccharide biosynthesis
MHGIMLAPDDRRKFPALTPRTVLSVLFRTKKLIAWTMLAASVGVLAAILLLPQQYEAEMKILLERERFDPVVTSQDATTGQAQVSSLTDEEINAEVDLLQSRDLLQQVVVSDGLQNKLSWLALHMLPDRRRESRIDAATAGLLRNMDVQPPNKSHIVTIRYQASDPKLSAQVLNTLGALFLSKHLQVHRPPGQSSFFDDEVARLRTALKENEAKLVNFSHKEGVISADTEKAAILQQVSLFDAALHNTEASISATQQRIHALESELNTIPQRRTTEVKTSAVLLEQMKTTLFNLEQQRATLLTTYSPAYRGVTNLDQQIAAARSALERAQKTPTTEQTENYDPAHDLVTAELMKARSDLAAVKAQAAATAASLADYRHRAQVLTEKGMVQQELLRTQKVTEDNFLDSVRKQANAHMSDALDKNRILNASIAETALVPALPKYSMPLKITVGMLLVMLVSFGAAFIADYWDTSFRTPDEVRSYLGLPVLAALPYRSLTPWPPNVNSSALAIR